MRLYEGRERVPPGEKRRRKPVLGILLGCAGLLVLLGIVAGVLVGSGILAFFPPFAPQANKTSTPTQPPTGTPFPTFMPTPPPPTKVVDTPTSTPTPVITPTPSRIIEAEWPEKMEVGRSDYIRISLVRTAGGQYVPTVEVPGHTVVAGTPLPVGTPGPLEWAQGPAYKASAIAILEGQAFELDRPDVAYQPLDQDRITWDWFVRALEPGKQTVIARVIVRWEPTGTQGEPIEVSVWRQPLEIEVTEPWLKTDWLEILSPASGVFGLSFSAPWVYQQIKKLGKKRALPGTTHVLSFERLSPVDFERLCLWLVEREGYTKAEHLGLAGGEQGRDVVAYKPTPGGLERWYFQCKRYSSISARVLIDEVDKYLQLAQEEPRLWPDGVVFVVSCAVSAGVRERVGGYCKQHGLEFEFWALTELDMRVKRHPDLLEEFFNLGREL